MKLSTDEVAHVGKLANLPLTNEELEKYSEQLSAIVEYIDQLEGVDVSGVEPIYDVSPNKSVMREDEVQKSLAQEEALQNGSNVKNGFFVTKGVFADE